MHEAAAYRLDRGTTLPLGKEVRVCAPPEEEFTESLARLACRLCRPASPCEMLRQARVERAPPDLPTRAAALFASQFGAVASAAA